MATSRRGSCATAAYFREGRAPTATVTLRLEHEGLAAHLTGGTQWPSAACDVL